MRLTAEEKARKKAKKEARHTRVLERGQALASHPLAEESALDRPSRYGRLEFHECRVDDRIFVNGIGAVIVARSLRADRLVVATFLVDIHCLGVKDAFILRESPDHYKLRLLNVTDDNTMNVVTPEYACTLVASAVEYARGLGLEPHVDYARVSEIFAGVDLASCETPIPLGRDGMPLYVAGPHEDVRRRTEIMDTLTRTVGGDNFHYIVTYET